jgi:hypothetical protein
VNAERDPTGRQDDGGVRIQGLPDAVVVEPHLDSAVVRRQGRVVLLR